jgi:hypothetical protein
MENRTLPRDPSNPAGFGCANLKHMQLETLQDLYVHELKDLYSAEKQLIRALAQDGQSRQERQTSDRL